LKQQSTVPDNLFTRRWDAPPADPALLPAGGTGAPRRCENGAKPTAGRDQEPAGLCGAVSDRLVAPLRRRDGPTNLPGSDRQQSTGHG